ncbi:hypothetical protein F511_14276 [Dorcoceras hygrometricum]|uniref:At4g15545-like C-terminal domain-containing protein n=1 Tax=Dorcoceras hygrometricum TaxID=472368 RepID=A0A2Z7BRJ8_9LAMI|nr:hypothetical protein F511_14276 [Dorcoceras hygrometricum]
MASGLPSVNKVESAHQMYREGKYMEALGYYTDALSMARTKPQKIALHSNRAACYLKLRDFNMAAEECTSVLELDQNHTGALMLRAQTLVTLKEYHSALFDVNRLIELNPASEVYRNLQARLKTQLSLAPIPEDEAELEEDYHSASDGTELEEKGDEREGIKEVEKCENQEKDMIDAAAENVKRNEISNPIPSTELGASRNHSIQKKSNKQSGWQTIPKPKGHSNLDYSRWDTVEDDSTEEEDEDEDEDSQPQYRFRVKTISPTFSEDFRFRGSFVRISLMAQGGSDGCRVGPDLNLPDDILSVIPTDPYDQLDLARKITSMAIASRVSKLETEAGRLQQKLQEKDRRIVELEDKVSELETAYEEAELRLKSTHENNMKLLKERDSLALTAKKLGRDLAKLETFKRQLMQSLSDENTPLSLHQTETVDIGTYDLAVPKTYSTNDEKANDYQKYHSFYGPTDNSNTNYDVSKQRVQSFSMTRFVSPRLTPSGTPNMISASVSPRKYSATGSPQKTSGTNSPMLQYDGRGSLSAWFPSSQQSSAANSPPRGRPLSGLQYVLSRLSLEQFSAFLTNIKELNAQRQSREETLRKAEEIFGTENKDLYVSFQGLLSRNMR